MAYPRRPIPVGFAEDAHLPYKILHPKYHCSWDQLRRWRIELGFSKTDNRCSPVIQMDKDGNEIRRFASIKEAAASIGGSANNISIALSGKYQTAYKFKWRYADED